MKHTYITRRTACQPQKTLFLMATVFYALLFISQLGAIIEGLISLIPGLILCSLWILGAAGCYLAADTLPVLEGGKANV